MLTDTKNEKITSFFLKYDFYHYFCLTNNRKQIENADEKAVKLLIIIRLFALNKAIVKVKTTSDRSEGIWPHITRNHFIHTEVSSSF